MYKKRSYSYSRVSVQLVTRGIPEQELPTLFETESAERSLARLLIGDLIDVQGNQIGAFVETLTVRTVSVTAYTAREPRGKIE